MGYSWKRIIAVTLLATLLFQIHFYTVNANPSVSDGRSDIVFRVAIQDGMHTYNPLIVEDQWTWEVMKLMFEGLTYRNISNNYHIEPWAAEWFHHGPESTWDTSVGYPDNDNNTDYRNWTVKLRDGIKWHDWRNQTGDDRYVRPHDVIFSLRMLADTPRYMWKVECIVARNPNGTVMYGRDLPANGTIPLINYDGFNVSSMAYWVNLSYQKEYPDLPVIYAWKSDNLTMHFFLTFEYRFFTSETLQTPIFPERIWKDHVEDRFTWNDPKCLISFGLCEFNYWNSTSETGRIDIFRDYFHKEYDEKGREKPYIDGITFKVYRNTDAAVQALQSGAIDFIDWSIDPAYVEEISDSHSMELYRIADYGFRYLTFNMRIPDFGYAEYREDDCGFSSPETGNYTDIGKPFRVAVSHLIDKKNIVLKELWGFGTVGTSVISPANTFWYNPKVKVYEYNITKANDILDSYAPDTDGDGIRELPYLGDGRIDISTPANDYDPMLWSEGMFIRSVLTSEAHLNVDYEPTSESALRSKLDEHDFQMSISEWSFSTIDDSVLVLSNLFSSRYDFKGGSNYPGYHNRSYDHLCMELMGERDPYKAREIAYELQSAIGWDAPYVVLYYRDYLVAYSSELSGIVSRYEALNWELIMNIYKPLENWEMYLDMPSTVEGGKEIGISAYLYEKGTNLPIQGVEVTFSVSDGTLKNDKNITDEYGKASVAYIPPIPDDGVKLTIVDVNVCAYSPSSDVHITRHASIMVIPPNKHMKMEMEIYPGRYINIRGNQRLNFEIKVYGNGNPLWPYNETNGSGVKIKCHIIPHDGSFELSDLTNNTWEYVFSATPHGNITRYSISISVVFDSGFGPVATAWDNITVNVLPEENITYGNQPSRNEAYGEGWIYLLSGTVIAISMISSFIWYMKKKKG